MSAHNEPADRKQVLVAVDFSDDSRAALEWAGRYAAAIGRDLLIVHVVHDPAAEPGYYWSNEGKHVRPMQDVAARMLAEFVEGVDIEPPAREALRQAEHRLVRGLPPGRIVELAEAAEVELIVLGSRGMTGLPHIMQGSVSERVVELASGPVVVVKARGKRQRDEEKARRKAEKKRRKEEKNQRKQERQRNGGRGRPADPEERID